MTAVSIPLSSSALSSATYDPDTRVLDVTFVNGRTYTHPDVPQAVVDGLASAASAGAYYNAVIKGVYG